MDQRGELLRRVIAADSGPWTVSRVRDVWVAGGVRSIGRRTARRALERLADEGVLERDDISDPDTRRYWSTA